VDGRPTWVGFGDPGGVSHIQNGHVRNYGEKEGIGRGATNMLAEDARGIVWTGNRNGLFSFAGDRWDHWTSTRGVPEGQVYSAYVDKSGTFFVGTATSLLRRREGSERFEVFKVSDVVTNERTVAMCQAKGVFELRAASQNFTLEL